MANNMEANATDTGFIDKETIALFIQHHELTSETLERLVTQDVEDSISKSVAKDIILLMQSYEEEFTEIKHILTRDYQQKISVQVQSILETKKASILGAQLLNQRKMMVPIYNSTIINSLSLEYWEKIRENSLNLEKFIAIKNKLKKFYKNHLDTRIQEELRKVPIKIDESVKKEYRKQYYREQLTFQDFLDIKEKSKSTTTKKSGQNVTNAQASTDRLRKDFEAALEKKKIEHKKRKQMDSFDNYEKYFNMSERDLRRAKRSSNTSRRKNTDTSQRRRNNQKKKKEEK